MHMTRENKLALVVGFGLILFVGILISDHFSTAQNQESANLRGSRAVDPLVQSRRNTPNLIDVGRRDAGTTAGSSANSPLAMSPAQIPSRNPDEHRTSSDEVQPVIPSTGAAPVERIIMGPDPRATINDPTMAFHDVQRGETLISICREHYNDESLVNALASFNGLSNPNQLRANHRLRIPSVAMLRPGSAPAAQAASSARPESRPANARPASSLTIAPPGSRTENAAADGRTYTVESGDTLSEISLRTLGTSKRWREIYELNRSVIDDPNNVIVGTTLKLPPRESNENGR